MGDERTGKTRARGKGLSDLPAVAPVGASIEASIEERDDELLEWLGRNDALTLGERVERLRFLTSLNEKYGAAWVGFYNQAHEYLEHAARCYLEGLYVPCIVMCQTAVEEQLRGFLRSWMIDDLVAAPMSEVLQDKRVRKAYPRALLRRLEALRGRRNIYIHPPGPLTPDGLLDSRWLPNRMVNQKKEAEEIYHDDARAALDTVAVFFGIAPAIGV